MINVTNVACLTTIPTKHKNKGSEAFVEILKSHPLKDALDATPDSFLPKQICEFYYICSFDEWSGSIP